MLAVETGQNVCVDVAGPDISHSFNSATGRFTFSKSNLHSAYPGGQVRKVHITAELENGEKATSTITLSFLGEECKEVSFYADQTYM